MKERIEDWVLEVVAWVFAYRHAIKKGLLTLVALGAVAGLTMMIVNRCKKESPVLTLEDTIASIEEVRPRGVIYVCSSLIEDYVTKRAVERGFFFVEEEHSCVQTMTQKCSYVIDLDEVEYVSDSIGVVKVKLPKVKYVASTQSTAFISDDGDYWAEHLPNTNEMKRSVEEKIKRRFDTAENRRKAEMFAEEAIREVIGKLGYEVEFVRVLERKGE